MKDFPRLAQSLVMAHKALMMYTMSHPQAQQAVAATHALLSQWLQDEEKLQFVVIGSKVFAGGDPQDIRNSNVAALAKLATDRAVSGLIFENGLSHDECLAFLEGLVLKPHRLDEVGGLEGHLRSRFVTHIKVSQIRYKEVQEGDEEDEAPILDVVPQLSEQDLARLLGEALRAALAELNERKKAGGSSGIPAAELGSLQALADEFGFGEGMPSPGRLAQIRKALQGLEPQEQLSVLQGLESLPQSPGGLAVGMRALVGETLAAALAAALSRGVPWQDLQHPLTEILRPLPERLVILRIVTARLRAEGHDPAPAEAALRSIAWDALSLEARLVKAMEEDHLFELTHEMRLALLRELLSLRRFDEFIQVQEKLLEALRSEQDEPRRMAARTLSGVARWTQDPGLPLGSEGPLAEALKAHFAWEPEPTIHSWTAQGLESLVEALVLRGDLVGALADLQEVEGLCAFLDEQHPWRQEALAALRTVLERPHSLDAAIDQAFAPDRDAVIRDVHPYLEALGDPMASRLVFRLEHETDRTRRGRLVEAIRSMGPGALSSILAVLASPTWYLVRNALTLLSDLGDAGSVPAVAPLLRHPDIRVRQSAVRALWKLGGPLAAPPLVARLKEADEETIQEILFALGQLQAVSGVPAVTELALGRRVPQRLRIQALETLGQIGDPAALPAILQCLRRKTLFSNGEEPPVRLAAAQALATLGTAEAMTALDKATKAEPKGETRDALDRLLGTQGGA